MSDQLDRDQEANALLAGDIRRSIRITVIGVTAFAILLMLGNHGNLEAGVTLLWVIGVPLLLLSVLARLVARWCGDATIDRPASEDGRARSGPWPESAEDDLNGRAGLPPWSVRGQLHCDRRGARQAPAVVVSARCRVGPTRPRHVVRRPVGWDHEPSRQHEPEI